MRREKSEVKVPGQKGGDVLIWSHVELVHTVQAAPSLGLGVYKGLVHVALH
jgi:hypothetical protein